MNRNQEDNTQKMNPPYLKDDWETAKKEDCEMERRQLLFFTASVADANKTGTKAQLMALIKPWEEIQDTVLELLNGVIKLAIISLREIKRWHYARLKY